MVNNIINLLNVVLHFGFTILFSKWSKKKQKTKENKTKKARQWRKSVIAVDGKLPVKLKLKGIVWIRKLKTLLDI